MHITRSSHPPKDRLRGLSEANDSHDLQELTMQARKGLRRLAAKGLPRRGCAKTSHELFSRGMVSDLYNTDTPGDIGVYIHSVLLVMDDKPAMSLGVLESWTSLH
jgi:hypothetical protein